MIFSPRDARDAYIRYKYFAREEGGVIELRNMSLSAREGEKRTADSLNELERLYKFAVVVSVYRYTYIYTQATI